MLNQPPLSLLVVGQGSPAPLRVRGLKKREHDISDSARFHIGTRSVKNGRKIVWAVLVSRLSRALARSFKLNAYAHALQLLPSEGIRLIRLSQSFDMTQDGYQSS